MKYYFIFLTLMSIVSMILYGADKNKAKYGKWRIKEITLLGVGLLGGAVGALLAMKLFKHKTKHWYFWVVNILGLLLQVIFGFYILITI